MNRTVLGFTLVAAMVLSVADAYSHSRWLLTSHANISNDKTIDITVDASISNELFFPDIPVGGQSTGVQKSSDETATITVIQSDGVVKEYPLYSFARKSTGVVPIEKNGTHKVSIDQKPIFFTSYLGSDGKPGRFFGSYEGVKSRIPDGAKNITEYKVHSRMDSYVTKNELSKDVLKHSKKGLSLNIISHPSELFVGDSLRIETYFNGALLPKGVSVQLVAEGTRFRDVRGVMKITPNSKGTYGHSLNAPGRYLLEVEYEIEGGRSAQPNGDQLSHVDLHMLYLTFEVYPE